ncbi:sn-glycerol-3-phosphate ABC transporter ATP-binding protein UgpC [Paraburkholderia dipogonis]|uniref:sn-glycerol-3-phosphate ABC transporter ATP-binding protein UgpC n=1 Tax=Paraburkholderia dipogonis TaxID=1211383 RepID=A0A4Y8MHD4_9BURK|nr:sn-glycerol-3-phosphate ABC transporter ATP-binding protein UgpC [Paraburkholderia dipogonis]TFE36852.1 sn-glycerol-3-phosphate ABC transporter ATP-binding protein UgpC [Paraburkholderia dipogonis]
MASLHLTNIKKRYDETEVLHDVNLEIGDGEFVVFVGPSGCGKSTLMRMIAGLEDISAGDLLIDGTRVNDVPPAKRGIAMVFQSYALYPHMTLYDNMAFGLKLAGHSKAEIEVAVRQAAKTLHIDHLLDRKPKQLSGGQRQRVAIGRAITRKPKVFLFDEPLSNLDAALRVKMRLEFARLHDELKTTMIYVTHDQIEAMTLADKIVVMSAGNVEQVGTPNELYHFPVNRFVAGFIGSPKMNFLRGELAAADDEGALVRFATGATQRVAVDASRAQIGDAVTVGIRPEHLRLASQDGSSCIDAITTAMESLGDSAFLYSEAAMAPDGLIARVDPLTRQARGETLTLSASPSHCHLFDDDDAAFPRMHSWAHGKVAPGASAELTPG